MLGLGFQLLSSELSLGHILNFFIISRRTKKPSHKKHVSWIAMWSEFQKSTLKKKLAIKITLDGNIDFTFCRCDTCCKHLQPRSKEPDTSVLTSLSFRVFLI